jgi:hypothetical protein
MKGHDWDMQVENESGRDMTISIVYYLIEKTGRQLQNCLVNSQEHESSIEYNSAAWLIAADKYVLRWLMVDLCVFLYILRLGVQREHASVGGW